LCRVQSCQRTRCHVPCLGRVYTRQVEVDVIQDSLHSMRQHERATTLNFCSSMLKSCFAKSCGCGEALCKQAKHNAPPLPSLAPAFLVPSRSVHPPLRSALQGRRICACGCLCNSHNPPTRHTSAVARCSRITRG
jgi:hypothetical protein